MVEHVSPEAGRLGVLAAGADGGPVVMLNLNRYRDVARYEPGHPDHGSGISGRDAYLKYGAVAFGAISHVGGTILWSADVTNGGEPAIGCDHDRYDEVVAVWYPSVAAFLSMESFPGYMDAHAHRDAGVEQAVLLPTRGEAEPRLRSPFS